MAYAKAAVVAGERKAGTSIRSRAGDLAAASLKALIRWPAKTVSGEQTGETSGAPDRIAQCRVCRRWARLVGRSLGTIFFSRHVFLVNARGPRGYPLGLWC